MLKNHISDFKPYQCDIKVIKNQSNIKKVNMIEMRSRSRSNDQKFLSHFKQVSNPNILLITSTSNDSDEELNTNLDNQDIGHYNFRINEVFNKNYIVVSFLSDGTFGRVVEVFSLKENQVYAMKIIRAVYRFNESAKIEAKIIKKLYQKSEVIASRYIVNIYECFTHKKNYCLVFEKLGISLYEFLKKQGKLDIKLIRVILKQILEALRFIHSCGLTHTDLKPENIMIQNEKGQPRIKLIDFGGATWRKENRLHLINTRQYRAPEVILKCCEWNEQSDLWSVGCIAMEMYLGHILFVTNKDDFEHLCMIEKCFGELPNWMLNQANEQFIQHRTKDRKSIRWSDMLEETNWQRIYKTEYLFCEQDEDFEQLTGCLFTLDPSKRPTANELLNHSFFRR